LIVCLLIRISFWELDIEAKVQSVTRALRWRLNIMKSDAPISPPLLNRHVSQKHHYPSANATNFTASASASTTTHPMPSSRRLTTSNIHA